MANEAAAESLPSLERRRTTDMVYDVLRGRILSNRYKPGERLLPDEMARQLGVSLTPVRQAVQQLSTEGLIEIRPRSGTFVASLNIRDIAETFDIRRALECLAAETAATNISEEDVRQIRRLVWALSEPVENNADRDRHEASNSELHMRIVEASGNRRLAEIYAGLKAHLQIARIHRTGPSGAAWAARLRQEQTEHEAILRALEARDRTALVNALNQHIERAKTDLVSTLQESVND